MEIDKKNLKCPFPSCKKDVDFGWTDKEIEISCSENNPVFYRLLRCHHCEETAFFLFKGLTEAKKEEFQETRNSYAMIGGNRGNNSEPRPLILNLQELVNKESKLIFQYPFRKTIFQIKGIPSKVKESLVEAEKCFSVGAKNGCATCLRKCVYALCDDIKESNIDGYETEKEHLDYVKKIDKLLPEQNEFVELLKHIKWLGDKHAHNVNEESYTYEDVKQALDIMPLIIKEIYGKKEKIKTVRNVLNQGLQKTKSK